MRRTTLVILAMLFVRNASAYHWFNTPGTGPATGTFVFHHWNTSPVHYIVDAEPLPSGVTIAANITPAFTTWQNVATSTISFQQDTNTTGIANFTWATSAASGAATPTWGITTDGRNEVGFVHNSDPGWGPGSYGLGLSTINTDTGEITDFALFVNIDSSGGTDPTLLGVMAHEAGHVIGVGHTSVGSPDFTFFPLPQLQRPTMFPYGQAGDGNRLESLEPDDVAVISRMYPDASFTSGQRMSGAVFKGTNGAFARGVYVRLVSLSNTDDQIATLSDFFGTGTGEWAIPGMPAGSWNVVIDPVSGTIYPGWIEDDGVGSSTNTYAGFPREHFDAAESNHDTATALLSMPIFANWDTNNVVLITNEGTRSDLAIAPWGTSQAPPAPPWWQTPDIWVNNDGDSTVNEPNEPERGRNNNQLFARITNRGNTTSGSYRVRFDFKPYTTNASSPPIAIGSVNETTGLAAGATRDSSITWDLSNLSSLPAPFDTADHFCVQVTIEDSSGGTLTNDGNPANNFAQNNYGNVPMCTTCFQRAKFVMYNHLDRPARASLEWAARRGRGKLQFEQIDDPANVVLAAKEYRAVTAHLTSDSNEAAIFDVTQRLDGQVVGGLTMALTPSASSTDPTTGKRSWLLGVSSGTNWPLSDMRDFYEPSVYFALQLERAMAPNLRIALQGGYHEFDEKFESATNLGMTNLSLLLRWTGTAPTARPFVIAGPGAYRANGTTRGGVQFGVGYEVPVTPSVSLTAGATMHRVSGDRPRPMWIDGYLGFLFRIP